jgi:adenylate cyclase
MDTRRTPPPAARKVTLAEQATDPWLEAPRTVLNRLWGLVGDNIPGVGDLPAAFTPGNDTSGATVPPTVPPASSPASDPGMAPPVSEEGAPLAVHRSFAFVDVCGFTAYCDRNGSDAAVEILGRFRSVTRHVVGQRGVRVAKWLGDGVMLVGTEMGPLVAASVELVARFGVTGLDTHVGMAVGDVLLFEGDDYVGRTVNLAARLCEAAGPGEILAADPLPPLPTWIEHRGSVTVHVAGMGKVQGVHRLGVHSEVELLLRKAAPAA